MSILTRAVRAAAATSPRGITGGTLADPRRLSWAEVHVQATRMAGALAAEGVGRHGSVAVLASDAADVAPLAQAIWMRRAALTMLQQPTPRSDLKVWVADTLRAIRLINADVVVIGEAFTRMLDMFSAAQVTICSVESLRAGEPIGYLDVDEAVESDIAMRQLTSGSTGMPKAVEISHANIAANTIALFNSLDTELDNDVLASWLPLSHDMGMIGFVLFPMQVGAEVVVIPPDDFVRRPLVWAELISKNKATITAGPNFAYSLLTRVLNRAETAELDLSSLRVAVNAAEPLNHHDVLSFTKAAARFGMRPTAVTPAYGLAEATLSVSMAPTHQAATVEAVSSQAITESHRADLVAADSPAAQLVVCLGVPVTGMEVRITRHHQALGPREIGVIELRSTTIAGSYLAMEGTIPLGSHDGWFDSGDLGYRDEQGRIYVCGRTKDLIVVAGKNLYPHDIERAAETVDGVRRGCVVAVRVDAEREGFAVLAEVHQAEDETVCHRISRDITATVNRRVGHAPRLVRLLPAGTVPKTASGKLRRNSARELLLHRM